jgi:transcriptional regulator with XRE-family HTH domain
MFKFGLQKNPSEVQLELAQNIKTLRKQASYTQAELAIRSGVSLGSLKRFERTGLISLESLLQLAHVLNKLSDFEDILNPMENYKAIEKLFSAETE